MRRASAQPSAAKPVAPPTGKHVMPALEGGPSSLESTVFGDLDPDRVNQLTECLFTLNNRRFGPIPGAYVVVCTQPGARWCVGQLSADRARPVVLYETMEYDDPVAAQRAAERLREERGERPPARSL
ncbi:MAG: hypothetical protein FJ164_00535 [Gammaproteobacteria bacterium]|nr:hypothetical protein [Gammaproteobacteria bacterium]